MATSARPASMNMNLRSAANKSRRLYYARFLCRSWNARYTGGQQLEEFHIYYMKEVTLPDYQPSKVEKVTSLSLLPAEHAKMEHLLCATMMEQAVFFINRSYRRFGKSKSNAG